MPRDSADGSGRKCRAAKSTACCRTASVAESWTKTAAIGSNQTHRQCGRREQRRADGRVVLMVDQDDRPPDLVELGLPTPA